MNTKQADKDTYKPDTYKLLEMDYELLKRDLHDKQKELDECFEIYQQQKQHITQLEREKFVQFVLSVLALLIMIFLFITCGG